MSQLDGCATITHFDTDFKSTLDDPRFKWYATGHAVVGENNCIGHAVEPVAGATAGNCHGAG